MRAPYIARGFFIVALFFFAQSASIYSQQPSSASQESQSPPLEGALQSLATQILQQAKKVRCHIGNCRILVTNFVLPDGHASPGGLQLADALSAQLSQVEKTSAVIDRSLFQSFLQRERLSAQLQNEEPVACWLARELKADAVIVGETTKTADNAIGLSVRLLNANEEKEKTLSLEARLPNAAAQADLSPTDTLPRLPSLSNTLNGEKVYREGAQGVGLPRCPYAPEPEYTQDARASHFSGTVLLEGIIGTDGKIHALRIVKGAPYGLNHATLMTLRTWKCTPAELNGKPVSSVSPIEVSFAIGGKHLPSTDQSALPPACPSPPQPHYTKEARAAKFQGTVHVDATLGVDGKIENIRILDSPGLGLDAAVKKALTKWKCRPAIVKGKPAAVTYHLQFNFRLR
jgi:TonB family protein